MFSYQKSLFNPTLPVDEAQFHALVRATLWNEKIDEFRKTGDAKLKRGLPAFIFQATFDETESKKGIKGCWRKQAATRLTGLVVMDVDHVEAPRKTWELIDNGKLTIDNELRKQILLVYITPSGKGLKIVFKARTEWGNLIDNQHQMAKLLGVEIDESCKDASRMSFICKECDILYLDKELFTYENPAYGEKYNEAYRKGFSAGGKVESGKLKEESKEDDKEEGSYHGVKYADICQAWQAAQGGAPSPGDRHRTMLQLAGDLRYICDNNPEVVGRVLRSCGFVRDVISERGEQEVDDVARAACDRASYQRIPKRMQGVLEGLGIRSVQPAAATGTVGDADVPYEQFAERLEPLLSAPYAEACRGVSRKNWLGAVFAAGAMYCTLMTRCWYKHFTGARQRLNPQVLIIGHPASGKSFAKELDDQIMCSMRAQDEEVRLAETRYKQEQKKRGTSSKAQKQDALVEPEGMIRYLPTKTSNNIFFRRLKRAKELVDGEQLPLHVYMFDSELDSSITAQSGGAWIGKHDLELKAVHNELSGVDYANGDSINDILPVY